MEEDNVKRQTPVDVILKEYVDYIYNNPKDKTKEVNMSAFEYRSVTSAFGVEKAFSKCLNPNAARCFLDLLPKLLFSKHKGKIEDLIADIDKDLKENDIWKEKSTYRCYLNQFIIFVQNKKHITTLTKGLNKYKSQLKITPADEALLKGVDGEIYTYSVLKAKFRSRLRSQDRVSGDKIWLPLRFIAKIYSTYVKKQKIKENDYLDWLNSLVDDIYILYKKEEDGEGKIMNVKFSDNVSLRLEKINNDSEYSVFVRLGEDNDNPKEYRVLTPTGKGNEKIEMKVTSISAIAIDHTIPIDKILRELDNKLNELRKVSDAYKVLQEQDDPDEATAINELLKDDYLKMKELGDELNLIKECGPLRLMDSKCNTQKSNGETFIKFHEKGGKYYGILSEDVRFGRCMNLKMTLYQDLSENGISRVSFYNFQGTPVTDLAIYEKKKQDFINLI